jgi:hypothetical protein
MIRPGIFSTRARSLPDTVAGEPSHATVWARWEPTSNSASRATDERDLLGKQGITTDTALRLERFLNTSAHEWMPLPDWDPYQAMQLEARRAS